MALLESRFRVMCLRCETGKLRPIWGRAVDYGRNTDPMATLPKCDRCHIYMAPVPTALLEKADGGH